MPAADAADSTSLKPALSMQLERHTMPRHPCVDTNGVISAGPLSPRIPRGVHVNNSDALMVHYAATRKTITTLNCWYLHQVLAASSQKTRAPGAASPDH